MSYNKWTKYSMSAWVCHVIGRIVFIGIFTFLITFLTGGFEMPYFIIVKLFFALFGLSSERDVMLTPENPDNIKYFQVIIVLVGNIFTLYCSHLSLSSSSTCWSPRSSSSTSWSRWCLTLTREYKLVDILKKSLFNENEIFFLSATIRHGVEVW